MKVHAVIVAAGTGQRTGRALPKQFDRLSGKPVYRWSLDALLAHPEIETVALVLPDQSWIETIADDLAPGRLSVVSGGASRSQSVLNGLAVLDADDDDLVLIHDAARPGLSPGVIGDLIAALSASDAAAPALRVTDALKRQTGEDLADVPRADLHRVQTPQAFRVGLIRKALSAENTDFVDDLAAVEALGAKVRLLPGSERLHKITYDDDFAILEALMAPVQQAFRTGSGYDVHALIEGDGVTLCGVHIAHDKSLSGHSDADVGWHALTDAIFGALALGDLGDHFPPSDERWKGASSDIFLRHAANLALERGWQVANADITLICEAPKIKPHREAMRQATAKTLGLGVDQVSVKATTTEGLGFAGRREGIAAQAVVMLSRMLS